jgi:hypothetical protein
VTRSRPESTVDLAYASVELGEYASLLAFAARVREDVATSTGA